MSSFYWIRFHPAQSYPDTSRRADESTHKELVDTAVPADRDLASNLDAAQVNFLKDELRALIRCLDKEQCDGAA